LYIILLGGSSIYYVDLGTLDLHQQTRNAMDWMVREIREAGASSVSITVIDANSDRITFNTPNETGIQYYRNGNQVIREYPSATTRVVGNNINRLKFTQTGSLLQIQLRAEKTALNRPLSFSLTEQVRMRND
ncbi:MAG: hypothetical protein ACOY3D_06160, partial [Candidatus Omnitrophota bacterium]